MIFFCTFIRKLLPLLYSIQYTNQRLSILPLKGFDYYCTKSQSSIKELFMDHSKSWRCSFIIPALYRLFYAIQSFLLLEQVQLLGKSCCFLIIFRHKAIIELSSDQNIRYPFHHEPENNSLPRFHNILVKNGIIFDLKHLMDDLLMVF